METMKEWFGLRGSHHDFTVENDLDARLLFARSDLDETLQTILRKSFRTLQPPKLVLYGEWGIGKTHMMRHLEYVLENEAAYQAKAVFVELPDVTAKSDFSVAQGAMLDALSLELGKQWILAFHTKHGQAADGMIREFTQSGDTARAFANLLAPGDGSRIAWDWLRGVGLNAADARLVGLPPVLAESSHFVRVLQMFGRLAADAEGKMLIFMLDEATKLGDVTNPDAVNHWTNALKGLADTQSKEVGLIISGAWIDPDDMPLPLQDVQVSSRFGDEHYLRLHNFEDDQTDEFIGALLEEWIDDALREELIATHQAEANGEEVVPRSFPFTVPAKTILVSYCLRHGGFTTPRDIQQTINDLLNRAMDDDRHIVDEDYMNSLVTA